MWSSCLVGHLSAKLVEWPLSLCLPSCKETDCPAVEIPSKGDQQEELLVFNRWSSIY